MLRLILFVLLTSVCYSKPSYALRCGHLLVEAGDYREDVYDKCGEPVSIQSHYERRINFNQANNTLFNQNNGHYINNRFNYGQAHSQEIEVLVEEWRYDFGSRRLRKLIRFENGLLKEIVDLGRR